MKPLLRMLIIAAVVAGACSLPITAGNLEGKWLLELGFGQWEQGRVDTEIALGSVESRIGWNDMVVSFTAGHWMQEDLAIVYSASGLANRLDVKVGIGGVRTADISVSSHYFGLRYYLPKSTLESRWRPYLTGAVGPVIGSSNSTIVGLQVSTDSKNETVLGGRIGGGLDVLLSRRVKLGVLATYNSIGEFDSSPLNGTDYGGGEFFINFGVLLGKHRN